MKMMDKENKIHIPPAPGVHHGDVDGGSKDL
jgi:hypothetical protein